MSSDYNKDLFGTIDRFIVMKIGDKEYKVPERLELLRIFQFLDFTIDYARLCWNGSCKRCIVSFEQNGKTFEAMSCRLKSLEGIAIKKLPPTVSAPEKSISTESSE